MSIEVRNVTKSFGSFVVLRDVNLTIPSGELVALLGPSGSGKTTLLRIIAGLEFPDLGSIHLEGAEATGRRTGERGVGFVFQHYALFRHMTVFENVAFGLRVRPRGVRPSRPEITAKVRELLELVQLDSLADRYPDQLSGGQRQRVALARALAVEPKVLLLDEPFGSLDARVRKGLRKWLRSLHDNLHVTSVFVTHDQEEALELADRVVVMNEGQIQQVGRPTDVYHRPANPFVYNFLGTVNLFHGRVADGNVHIGNLTVRLPEEENRAATSAVLYVRPHQLIIHQEPDGELNFKAHVRRLNPAGPIVKVELRTEWGALLEAEITQERYQALSLVEGAQVFVVIEPKDLFIETRWDGPVLQKTPV